MRHLAVVTGASGAIGEAVALALAVADFDVALLDLDEAELIKVAAKVQALGANCRTYACDVSDEACVEGVVAEICAGGQSMDVLVNCAGIVHFDNLLDMSFATWRRVMSVNADGTFLVSQAVSRAMRNQPTSERFQRRGLLVNVASAAAELGRPTRAAYGASKAVVRHLTMSQALALEAYGIAACVIYPGEVIEGMLLHIYEEAAASQGRTVEDVVAEALSEQPSGMFQAAGDVAQRVVFLANSTGLEYTGTLLWCDSHVVQI